MRFGPQPMLIPGVCMIVVALLLFARTPVDGNYLTDLLPPFLLIGIGIGSAFPAIMTLAMSGATPEDAGLASGLVNTSMQVGGAIGLAVLATLSTERTQHLVDSGVSNACGADLRLPPRLPRRRRAGGVAVAIAVFVLRDVVPAGAGEGAAEPAPAPERREEREPAYSEAG